MAEVVIGLALSHSPMVVAEDELLWLQLAEADRVSPYLRDEGGAPLDFAELESRNGSRRSEEASRDHLRDQLTATKRALQTLKDQLAAARPDVAVVVGDDQLELFDLANMPALGVFYGNSVVMATRTGFRDYRSVGLDQSLYAAGVGMDRRNVWPGHPELAEHLIVSLVGDGFDVTAVAEVPEGERGLGHAFGIVPVQLTQDRRLPLVPVFVNDYWPPNQVAPGRCRDLGSALRKAVDVFPEDLRVAVVATGGLSHFVTDEELDRFVLDALARGDVAAVAALPAERLTSGNSEIRNWIVAASACEGLAMAVHAYVPVYRTAAGTGCGLAFASWS